MIERGIGTGLRLEGARRIDQTVIGALTSLCSRSPHVLGDSNGMCPRYFDEHDVFCVSTRR